MLNKTEGKCKPKMMMIIATNTKNTTSRILSAAAASPTASLSVSLESVDLIETSGALASIKAGLAVLIAYSILLVLY